MKIIVTSLIASYIVRFSSIDKKFHMVSVLLFVLNKMMYHFMDRVRERREKREKLL